MIRGLLVAVIALGATLGEAGCRQFPTVNPSSDLERQGREGATQTTTYKLDGSEQDIQMGQMTAKATAKIDGQKLVIVTKTEQGENTQTWTLNGGVLTIERAGARGTSKTVYKKGTT